MGSFRGKMGQKRASPPARVSGGREGLLTRGETLDSGRLERLAADRAVARAQLVGLQRVEHAQHFLRVAADRQVVDRGEADDAVRIDDEGRAQRHAGVLVEDAERIR
jgi:hypothetical protein